jgi:hypothetical protein
MTKTIEQLQAKVAELEKENARLKVESRDACLGLNDYYGRKLAAEQLNNKLLRDALEFLNARIVTMDLGGVVERALSLPPSTEALDKYVAEKVKEENDQILAAKNLLAIMHRDGGHHEFAVGFDQAIQDAMAVYYELTKQRDLAVSGLKAIAGRRPFIDNLASNVDIAVMTLDAIKESDGK